MQTLDIHHDLYSFCKEVALQYEILGPHGPLHIDRLVHCENAITAVFNFLPATSVPFNGNVATATQHVLPVLEAAFAMPPTRPGVGSKQWIEYMTEHPDEASFEDLCDYPAVFKSFLKLELRRGTREGKPRPQPGESLDFSNLYRLQKKDKRKNMLSPRTGTAHQWMTFCRGVSHNTAIKGCRNHSSWPVIVKAKNSPTGQTYDNSPRCLYMCTHVSLACGHIVCTHVVRACVHTLV